MVFPHKALFQLFVVVIVTQTYNSLNSIYHLELITAKYFL